MRNPSRRTIILSAVAAVAVVIALVTFARAALKPKQHLNPQAIAGPVLLVPGYGGSTDSLNTLQQALQQHGRTAILVTLPDSAQGDIDVQARALAQAVTQALATSTAATVDIVGYSAGGLVTRDYVKNFGGGTKVRRVVTLGSPQHGTKLAGLGAQFQPGLCPTACQQMAPGSKFLNKMNQGDESPSGPTWVSIYTDQDEVVTPPTSAKLDGALNIKVQDVCANAAVSHGTLPSDPITVGMVLRELQTGEPVKLGPADCASLGRA